MRQTNELGDFLRARRALVRPEDVGVTPGTGHRRVPGLRRAEVALLAGISSDYFVRLEQGRDRHPSAEVVAALARALRLDADATAHLRRLARPSPRRPARRRPEHVSAGMRHLVMSRTDMPAFVLGRYLDVLVANALAVALSPCHAPGVNALRAAFLDPEPRALYEHDWDGILANLVAGVRAMVGPETHDPYLSEMVGELSARSEEFRRLWARHDVRPRVGGTALLHHPRVGPLELNYEKLGIPGTGGQVLVVFHAAPGSEAAGSLTRLGRLAAAGPVVPDAMGSSAQRT